MSKVTTGLAFIFGVGVGALATWRVAKGYYEKIADEEIESVKETFSKRAKDTTGTIASTAVANAIKTVDDGIRNMSEASIKAARTIAEYTNYAAPAPQNDYGYSDVPVIIEDEEFGQDEMYDKRTLTYYKDGVLADIYDNPVEFDEVVGEGNREKFMDPEDNVIYIRNDEYQTYYEVVIEDMTYDDAVGSQASPSQEE